LKLRKWVLPFLLFFAILVAGCQVVNPGEESDSDNDFEYQQNEERDSEDRQQDEEDEKKSRDDEESNEEDDDDN
jgi:hypothetical protein